MTGGSHPLFELFWTMLVVDRGLIGDQQTAPVTRLLTELIDAAIILDQALDRAVGR